MSDNSVEFRLGELKAVVDSILRGQEHIRDDMIARLASLAQAQIEHEKHDDRRFDGVWKVIGSIRVHLALYAGAIGILYALAKLALG